MSIEVSHDTEARITDEARRQGLSVDALLQQLIGERGVTSPVPPTSPQLPVWHLGAVGSLRRRDIYEDVR